MEKFPEYEQDRPKLKIELGGHVTQFVEGLIKKLALKGYVVCDPQCREISDEDWMELKEMLSDSPRNIREYLTRASEGETEIEAVLNSNDWDRRRADFLDLVLTFFYGAIKGKSAVEFWYYYGNLHGFVSALKH